MKTRFKTQNFNCWILLWCVWICRNKHTNNRMGWWAWAAVSRDVWMTIHSTLTFTPFATLERWLHGRHASFVWRPRRHPLLKMGLYHLPQSCNGFTSLFPLCNLNRGGITVALNPSAGKTRPACDVLLIFLQHFYISCAGKLCMHWKSNFEQSSVGNEVKQDSAPDTTDLIGTSSASLPWTHS